MKSTCFTLSGFLMFTLPGSCFTAGLADAQGGAGAFTPPFEARWSLAVVPAGDGSFTLIGQEAVPGASPGPASDLSLEERADLYMARKMFREAIETYNRIEPKTPATLNMIGIAYQQQFDHAAARQYYERAIKARPNYAEAINNLGTLYYVQGNYRRATALYQRALALQPRSPSIHINLGMAWLARHNDAQWQRNLQKALELDPDIFERRGSHGVLIEEHSTTARAKFDFYLARLYARRGNNELALQYIRKALECGLKERRKLLEDEDFAAVRALPEFGELMKQPPKVL
ncbi:MAG: tetratricopeptide repeat protein [Bryobacteraceae bacterium]